MMHPLLRAALAAGLLLAAAACRRGYDPDPQPVASLPAVATTPLAKLHALVGDRPVIVDTPTVVTGLVTSSDEAGNFFRSLHIEEGLAGLEILCGLDALYTRYPIGTRIWIDLEGLCLDRRYGILRAGLPAVAGDPEAGAEPFYSQALLDARLLRGEREQQKLWGTLLYAGQLTAALNGALVLVTQLHYAPETTDDADAAPAAEAQPVWSGYRRFADRGEQTFIHLYTSPYARFADHPIPQGEVSLRGILQTVASGPHAGFVLKMRDDATDCFH